MAQGSYINIPALQQKIYKKTLIKYQGTTGSIIATPFKILTREQKAALKSRTWLKDIAALWKLLNPSEKLTWKTYAANIHKTGWILYMSEYSYRRKYSLSLPPEPHELYQMYGLQISNPAGNEIVKAWRYDISVEGEITVSFNYKKIENSETGGLPFRVVAEANYFEQGENKTESHTFDAPAGNVSWSNVEFTFGTADRYYFELIISFELNNYQADVVLDNFKITDNIGILYEEPWHLKAGAQWLYQIRTRKMGWEFNQLFPSSYFQIVYTGE